MKLFEADISHNVLNFLNENLNSFLSVENVNKKMHDVCGVVHFFDDDQELDILKSALPLAVWTLEEPDRAEYGDFQTNADLANQVLLYLKSKNILSEVIIEPTCGKGNFIIAALKNIPHVKYIYGVEIYKPYVWETKFSILEYFLENFEQSKPDIFISHCNVFDFDFDKISKLHATGKVLIIGNPPWVTNSKLGGLNSINLPKKTNFKNHSGLDAITGKSNFDIAEFITIMLIETFQKANGNLLLLIKNSVIKNLLFDQRKNRYQISEIEKYCIDTKKEFNVFVEASLFYCKLNSIPAFYCSEFNFYENKNSYLTFGWLKDKFVSNIDSYKFTKEVDGDCPFVWRQGLKHDCSSIMELEKVDQRYINGLNEKLDLEDDLVYGLLKSSDLKNTVINQTRKFTIVTQKRVGQETKYIRHEYPKTYQYLLDNLSSFEARKSSIYNNKPLFSIFGIGDYSFMPYKVAISGFYKTFHFTLILPQNGKPVMLDDTCYLIGFDNIEYAVYSLILLNSDKSTRFLQSITFPDAKRTFTKDVLMRIDIANLAKNIDLDILNKQLAELNKMYRLSLNLNLWENFINNMIPASHNQFALFM